MKISSPVFEMNKHIPGTFTCDGKDVSPPLHWTDVPAQTKTLVLIVDDPDAPDPAAPTRTWVHWVVYNLPASCSGLTQAMHTQDLPSGTLEGINDWRRTGYGGPCPPIGRHRYFFKLYALDTTLPNLHQPNKDKLQNAMSGHVIAEAELIGTYQH
jgi:Raf kinase inhibitor-like YbhB/YbcL family protein